MKISLGGTPIFVTRRQKGGIEVIQGRSRLKLDKHEIVPFIEAIQNMSSDAQEGKEMASIGRTS
ncbi:hypothetical protein KL953_08595 [Mycolicibacterium goodii]|uniref:hypothetical protein n=1 Tax=Mycolicibacterium goodii TaxID=134601 RepID=UPI001BDCBB37|nr:hypothetical protein [Mycolicibacterium goodii]MBU8808953.1 hypothetical protein [Mycolicibacterium goodii]